MCFRQQAWSWLSYINDLSNWLIHIRVWVHDPFFLSPWISSFFFFCVLYVGLISEVDPGSPANLFNECVFLCAFQRRWYLCLHAGVQAGRLGKLDWCLIGACRWDLLLPVSVRITSSHSAQSYCLAISQSLWHHSIPSPYFFLFPFISSLVT